MARCLLDKAKSDLENYAILHFKALKRNLQQQQRQEFTHKSIKTARFFPLRLLLLLLLLASNAHQRRHC